MPNGDPRDGFFYPTLTLMIDSYNVELPESVSSSVLCVCDQWSHCYCSPTMRYVPKSHVLVQICLRLKPVQKLCWCVQYIKALGNFRNKNSFAKQITPRQHFQTSSTLKQLCQFTTNIILRRHKVGEENLGKWSWPRDYKTFFVLNSSEHGISNAHKRLNDEK